MLRKQDKIHITRYSTVAYGGAKASHGYDTTTSPVSHSVIPLISSIQFLKFQTQQLKRSVEEVKEIIALKKIDIVWAILNSASIIQITSEISKFLSIPIVAQIWDSPEYILKSMRLDPLQKSKVMSSFEYVLRNAKRGVVVSDSMGQIYKSSYGLESSTMVLCPPREIWKSVSWKQESQSLSVIFAGSLYAYKEWNSFLNAIEEFNSQGKSLTITVTCIGNTSRWVRKKPWVTYKELLPQEEAAKLVNEADIAYLPYWMDASHEHFVQTAFPGKLSFYVACGTPVFFHGPENSTPNHFLSERKVGLTCSSKRPEKIIEILLKISSTDFLNTYPENQQRTLEEVFHPDRSTEIFEETIHAVLQQTA